MRSFFRWLNVTGRVDVDPACLLQGPKQPKSLPHVIRPADMARLLSVYGKRDAQGNERAQSPTDLRNQALLEFLYACGARVSEASGLKVGNVDFASGQVKVFGKGSKERIIPLHDLAVSSLRAYLTAGRPRILDGKQSEYVFVSTRGNRMTTDAIRKVFKAALREAGSTRRFRLTTCATPLPPISLTAAPTCAASRRCWAMRACPPRRSTRTSRLHA